MPGLRKARIGDVLKLNGELTSKQVSQILAVQEKNGCPFGQLAQEMFGLTTQAIQTAWVDQYLTLDTRVDLHTQQVDPGVLDVITRRQAWQLQLMPLCRQDGVLRVATTQQRLLRSCNFVWRRLGEPVCLLIAPWAQLEMLLDEYYPWPAMRQQVAKRTTLLNVS